MGKFVKGDVVIILLSLWVLSGCSSRTDAKFYRYIRSLSNYPDSIVCYINIKDALGIDFDKMFLFGETTSAKEISNIIGIPYSNNRFISDSRYRIILLKDNEIVYEDDFYQRRISFDSHENRIDVNFFAALFTNSIFSVEKRRHDFRDHAFFHLTPQNDN